MSGLRVGAAAEHGSRAADSERQPSEAAEDFAAVVADFVVAVVEDFAVAEAVVAVAGRTSTSSTTW